jgi:hypothetical protein
MDPVTGEVLTERAITHIDPETDQQTGKEPWGKFDSEGVTSDVLSSDGESIFIKHMRFDTGGQELEPTVPHLFSHTGFLGEEWFVRSFWQVGTWAGAGWGGWASSAGKFPSGRILCFDENAVYGYGRVAPKSAATGHRADQYHLFALDRRPATPKPQASAEAKPKKDAPAVSTLERLLDRVEGIERPKKAKRRRGEKKGGPPLRYRWSKECPLVVRALAGTPDLLFLAGVPDIGEKSASELAYDNPKEALEALHGKRGSFLWTVSAATGEKLAEHSLPAPPVFDGLSVAEGKVFVSLKDGTLIAFAQHN